MEDAPDLVEVSASAGDLQSVLVTFVLRRSHGSTRSSCRVASPPCANEESKGSASASHRSRRPLTCSAVAAPPRWFYQAAMVKAVFFDAGVTLIDENSLCRCAHSP